MPGPALAAPHQAGGAGRRPAGGKALRFCGLVPALLPIASSVKLPALCAFL